MVDDSRHRTKLYLATYIINGNLTKDNDYYTPGVTGIADSGTTITTVDAARTEANDTWNGYYLKFADGNNQGCERLVSDFDAATDKLIHAAFHYAVSTDTYVLSSTSTAVSYIIAYGMPNYPLTKVFLDKAVDLVFSIGEPTAEPLLNTDQVPFEYEEHVPITVFAIDKTGITATELKGKAEAELKRICETYPQGSQRSMEKRRDVDQIIGKTLICGTEWVMNYRRDTTT